MPRFTATRVATLAPGTYADPGQAGLQLRVHQKLDGVSRTWTLRMKFRGEVRRIALGHFPEMKLDAARGEARRLRELASQGIDPRRARARRRQVPAPVSLSAAAAHAPHSIEHLVSEFSTGFLRDPHIGRKRPEYAEAILARDVLPEWRGRDVRTIEPVEVITLLKKIKGRGSPVAANRTASLLTQLFKFGIHEQQFKLTTSPVQLLYRPGGKEQPRERALSDEELRTFLKDPRAVTRPERLQHVIMVLLLTAARRGELTAAKWADIDLQAKTWIIPDANSKTGKGRTVPLSRWACDEFAALAKLAKRSAWVLPAADGDGPILPLLLTRGLARCQARFQTAGIAPFHLHDLRRTARTAFGKLGVQPHVAELALGHKQKGMVGVYDVGAYLDEQREALDRWAEHLQSLVGTTASPRAK
jgi:integrase